MNRLMLFILAAMSCVSCAKTQAADNSDAPEYTTIEQTEKLTIYYPQYSSVDLVTETMPNAQDANNIFCAEAAFTGKLLNEFMHENIAGDHVCSGKLYQGYPCSANTGCFVWYPSNTWKFLKGNYANELRHAAEMGGMGFGQVMVIFNGEICYKDTSTKKLWRTNNNYYRVLAEYNGQLCVIDSRKSVPYADFVNALAGLGVTHALYMDMGPGWNYSYYRDNAGQLHYIHTQSIKYTTNWIVFKK